MHVAIIGNGVVANLTALYLRKHLPAAVRLTLMGPRTRRGMPVVGESTIEITAHFLERELGLGEYLRDNHCPKYGLTYYFKLDPDDPGDRRYSVQCNEAEPERPADEVVEWPRGWRGGMGRPPSWQLDRARFDRDMRARVDEGGGVERVHAMVESVDLSAGQGAHRLSYREESEGGLLDARRRELDVDWVLDASGRRQVLGRSLGLSVKSPVQRSAFWFRLADFERAKLGELEALGPTPPAPGEGYHYERYYSSHHFMGRGNWTWMIPMDGDGDGDGAGGPRMSIGSSSRPDIYPHRVRNMADFLEHVGGEHPVIADLVRSGRVEDTNLYANYRYELSQVYSERRWAILGEAAVSLDPLFSNGLAFATMQIQQVEAMLARDLAGQHSPELIQRYERAWWAPVRASQLSIGQWYASMHDPVLSALRLHMIEVTYFHILLPLVVNRCHVDPARMGAWRVLEFGSGAREVPARLLELRERIATVGPEHFVYEGASKVNPRALGAATSRELREQFVQARDLLSDYFDEAAARLEGSLTEACRSA